MACLKTAGEGGGGVGGENNGVVTAKLCKYLCGPKAQETQFRFTDGKTEAG